MSDPFIAACCQAKTQEDFTRAVEQHLPDPFVYREGCDTGIFTADEFRAICSMDRRSSAWDLHYTLLEVVKSGEKQVLDQGIALTVLEIATVCNGPDQRPFMLTDRASPGESGTPYSTEIHLPFRRRPKSLAQR